MLDIVFPAVRCPRARGALPFFPFPLCLRPPRSFPARSARLAASGRSSSSPDEDEDSELKEDSENDTRRLLVGGSGSPSNASLKKDESWESDGLGESAPAFFVSNLARLAVSLSYLVTQLFPTKGSQAALEGSFVAAKTRYRRPRSQNQVNDRRPN